MKSGNKQSFFTNNRYNVYNLKAKASDCVNSFRETDNTNCEITTESVFTLYSRTYLIFISQFLILIQI